MGKTEACCDCAAIHDDVLEHVQEHIVPEDQRQSMAKLFKIFGDNTRCSIMEALNCHEMCVCDLAVLLDMTKSAISHQLKGPAGTTTWSKFEKKGKHAYYSLADGSCQRNPGRCTGAYQ